jgi:predicted amidophosphoribosyltransferase
MVRYATRYISPRSRPLTEDEKLIRQAAYELKIPTPAAIATAAPLMAALLGREPCWLIPIPSSTGSTEANMALCRAIKLLIPEARIVVGIRRTRPVESSCARRRRGLLGLSVEDHAFLRCCGPLLRMPVWFIDNVVTTGATLRAAHLAFGTGGGVVYADASSYALSRASRIDPVQL